MLFRLIVAVSGLSALVIWTLVAVCAVEHLIGGYS